MAVEAGSFPTPSGDGSVEMAGYATEAEREATDSGMAAHELRDVLDGRPITTLVPPRPTEDVVEYGIRATGEILVRYLVDAT